MRVGVELDQRAANPFDDVARAVEIEILEALPQHKVICATQNANTGRPEVRTRTRKAESTRASTWVEVPRGAPSQKKSGASGATPIDWRSMAAEPSILVMVRLGCTIWMCLRQASRKIRVLSAWQARGHAFPWGHGPEWIQPQRTSKRHWLAPRAWSSRSRHRTWPSRPCHRGRRCTCRGGTCTWRRA